MSQVVRAAVQEDPEPFRAAGPAPAGPRRRARAGAATRGRARAGTGAPPMQLPPVGSTERLAYQAARRAALTADRAVEQITADDVQDADPQVVNAWARAGKLAKFGVAVKQPRRG